MPLQSIEPGSVILNKTFVHTLLNLGDDTVGAAGPLVGALPRLTTYEGTISPTTPFATLIQAALGGAETTPLTFTPAFNLGSDKASKKTQIELLAGAAPTSETVTAALIVNAADDDWIAAFPFANGVLIEPDGGVSVDAFLPWGMTPSL